LLISTYGLRFVPCCRRLEGQRKRLWGKSEVPKRLQQRWPLSKVHAHEILARAA
jgi:hypothetical protein